MALSVDYALNGVQIPAAYVKVERVIADKATSLAEVSFSADSRQVSVFQKVYGFGLDLDGPNPIKQAYEHLKTLPEFADALDC